MKQKKVEGKTVRCCSWHEKGRRTDESHINEGTNFYCVDSGDNDFSLNVVEGKKAPNLRKGHGKDV